MQQDFRALPFLRPERLARRRTLFLMSALAAVRMVVVRTVILLELDDFDLGIMLFQVEQVGDFRAAPAVNALVVIAHHAEVAMLRASASGRA